MELDFDIDFEKSKRENALKDFNLLIQSGNLGFYQSVEFVQIFIFDKNLRKSINFFSLFTFSEKEYNGNESSEFLTDKLIKISDRYSFGIIRNTFSIESIKHIFSDINNGKFFIDEDECIISDKLYLLPKTFVPKMNLKNSPLLNEVIKPNYWGDNYIIEFFDEKKIIFADCDNQREYFDKVCNYVNSSLKTISINLSKVYDRIGNIIFQFPITLYKTSIESSRDSVSFIVKNEAHPRLKVAKNLSVIIRTTLDDVITGFFSYEINELSSSQYCNVGDDNFIETTVMDKQTNLILHYSLLILLKRIGCGMNIGIQNSEERILKDENGAIKKSYSQFIRDYSFVGKSDQNSYDDLISRRNINNDILKHSDDYFVSKSDDQKNALNFLIKKFSAIDLKEICLWDPYLSPQDIFDLLYPENTGVPFRCIGSNCVKRIITDNNRFDFNELKENFLNDFHRFSNNLNVTMKFLVQHGDYGRKFHDRFLILVPIDDTALPVVYSLGTSVNSLGKYHHIIQKITNPRIILANFEELWLELDNGNCCIVEYKRGQEC